MEAFVWIEIVEPWRLGSEKQQLYVKQVLKGQITNVKG